MKYSNADIKSMLAATTFLLRETQKLNKEFGKIKIHPDHPLNPETGAIVLQSSKKGKLIGLANVIGTLCPITMIWTESWHDSKIAPPLKQASLGLKSSLDLITPLTCGTQLVDDENECMLHASVVAVMTKAQFMSGMKTVDGQTIYFGVSNIRKLKASDEPLACYKNGSDYISLSPPPKPESN